MKALFLPALILGAVVCHAQSDVDKSLCNTGLFSVPAIVKSLQLSKSQDDRIDAIRLDKKNQMQKLDSEAKQKPKEAAEIAKRARLLSRALDLKMLEVLDAKQLKRMREASVQVAGANALALIPVQDKLKLTADQRKKVADEVKAFKQKQHAAHQADALKKAKDKKPGEMAAQLKQIGAEYSAAMKKILTESQIKTFRELQGEPIPGLVVTSVKI